MKKLTKQEHVDHCPARSSDGLTCSHFEPDPPTYAELVAALRYANSILSTNKDISVITDALSRV